jgi:hypothetical protein
MPAMLPAAADLRGWPVLKLVSPALLAVLLAPAAAWAWVPRTGPEANVRPCFDTGYTSPGGRPGYSDGYGFGVSFEVEQTRALSGLLRLELDWLTGNRRTWSYYAPSPVYAPDEQIFTWSIGVRGYLRSGATLRPYGEVDVGVRLGGHPDENGMAFAARAGISVASYGGAGLKLESGVSIPRRDPERYLFVPVRFGLIFP